MKNHLVYCSACDREVRVLITGTPLYEDQAPLHDEELICLDIGSRCTGSLCPLGAAAPTAMVGRLIRNGVSLDSLTTVTAECPACGSEAEMVLFGNGRAACSICGTAARWAFDHVEPED
jgi:ribosomal protein S27AE